MPAFSWPDMLTYITRLIQIDHDLNLLGCLFPEILRYQLSTINYQLS